MQHHQKFITGCAVSEVGILSGNALDALYTVYLVGSLNQKFRYRAGLSRSTMTKVTTGYYLSIEGTCLISHSRMVERSSACYRSFRHDSSLVFRPEILEAVRVIGLYPKL